MEKNGELKAGQSVCDYCSAPAIVVVAGGSAVCVAHAPKLFGNPAKEASADRPLRSSSPTLAGNFKE